MTKKILASLLVMLGVSLTTAPVFAQQIPSGYALVPISALGAVNAGLTTNTTTSTAAVSIKKSTLRASDELVFLGTAKSTLTATLRDTNGNPLAGHTVNLIGSRPADQIQIIQGTTNTNGEAVFAVTSNTEGVGTFTAIDTTSGTTLTERSRIVFLNNANAVGGDSNTLGNQLLAQTGDALNTELTAAKEKLTVDFPTAVAVNEPTDITVSITDTDGIVLEDYTGTVTFESTDPLALLPRDYTFTLLDRGIHTFANAVTLVEPGATTLDITTDKDTTPATLSVQVNDGIIAKQDAPIIVSPTKNSLFNQNTLTVSGATIANSNIVAFVNGQISERATSDLNGKFSLTISGLTDGGLELKVALLDFNDSIVSISDLVPITIDTTLPTITSVTSNPITITSGSESVITVQSEAQLKEAKLSLDGKQIDLIEGMAGAYSARVTATTPGKHLFDVTLVDTAGNTLVETAAGSITVETPITIRSIQTTPQSKRVNLTWDPPANHTEISYYTILYGRAEDNLDRDYTTADSGTSWHITGLNDQTVYYFQVMSYDTDGTPNGKSEVVKETPRSYLNLRATACDATVQLDWQDQADERIRHYQIAYGLKSSDYLERQNLLGRRTTWEVRNLINGVPYYFTVRGLDAANQIVFQTNEEVVATPGAGNCRNAAGVKPDITEEPIQLWQRKDAGGSPILIWNPVAGAAGYRVYAGTQPNYFDLPTAEVTTPYLKPTGLAANTEYYFSVRAFYAEGHEAANFSNVLKIEVGPVEALALAAGLAIMGSWLIYRRRQRN